MSPDVPEAGAISAGIGASNDIHSEKFETEVEDPHGYTVVVRSVEPTAATDWEDVFNYMLSNGYSRVEDNLSINPDKVTFSGR
ncbi:hypothetical protein [Salinibaculum rarum]|uniref:hypothetical protein n=1 Tax=Salinibaculum rarum TaxID=3058903 RepID=UPI00265E1E71|nr:hypothetical protein [Salinibaculum sp. KK48]